MTGSLPVDCSTRKRRSKCSAQLYRRRWQSSHIASRWVTEKNAVWWAGLIVWWRWSEGEVWMRHFGFTMTIEKDYEHFNWNMLTAKWSSMVDRFMDTFSMERNQGFSYNAPQGSPFQLDHQTCCLRYWSGVLESMFTLFMVVSGGVTGFWHQMQDFYDFYVLFWTRRCSYECEGHHRFFTHCNMWTS